MRKGIVLALILGACSAQGQEFVRQGGEATGVDSEVKDLVIAPGNVRGGLDDWRFDLHGHILVVEETYDLDYQFDGLLLLSPQFSVGKRLGATNYFVNGSLGVAEEIMADVHSVVIGSSIRWDDVGRDFGFWQTTIGSELDLEGYVGQVDLLLPSLNIYMSAQIAYVVLLDVTVGLGYCKPTTFEEPSWAFRCGIGMSIGGGI